jgi:hypothetical protein
LISGFILSRNKSHTMNLRKIKLALTIGLVNDPTTNPVVTIKNAMRDFTDQVGKFLGFVVTGEKVIDENRYSKSYAVQFENCQLQVQLVTNKLNKIQAVRDFKVSQ